MLAFLALMPTQSLSLLDSAATLSWLISLDVSLFFPDTGLMLASLLSLPSLDLELPVGRDYDFMVKTQALEMDRWAPVLVLPHPGCSISATY